MSETVLLLDGDARDADLLERALIARGWQVVRARDFSSALLAFESARPSVAVIAVDHLEGGRLLTALRSREDAAGFPVVLIDSARSTTHGGETRRSQAPIRPEDAVLLRPLSVEEVTDQLRWMIAFAASAAVSTASSEPPTEFGRSIDRPTELLPAPDEAERVVLAAEEAVRAAYEESFEREERLHRWTRRREEEREQTIEHEPLERIDFAEGLIATARALDPQMRVDLQRLPAETERDRTFTRALQIGATIEAAAKKANLTLERATAIVALGMLGEGVAPTDRSKPAARENADLAAWLSEHKDRDYFAILGLTRAASPEACAEAFAARRAALGLAERIGDPLADAASKLLEEARAVLSSPVLSAAYRANLDPT